MTFRGLLFAQEQAFLCIIAKDGFVLTCKYWADTSVCPCGGR